MKERKRITGDCVIPKYGKTYNTPLQSTCVRVFVLACVWVCLRACVRARVRVSGCGCVPMFFCFSVRLSVFLSVCLSICLFVCLLSVCLRKIYVRTSRSESRAGY